MAKKTPVASFGDASFETRLKQALAERDAALAQLAGLRAQLDNVRLAARNAGEASPRPYPVASGAGEPPLRYVLVDQANDAVKQLLGPLHRAVKTLATGLKSP